MQNGDHRCLVRPLFSPSARARIFCFSHAGGSASTFVPWARPLAPDIELVAVQLPGRGHRLLEPQPRAIGDIVEEVADALEPLLDRPFVLFGHSMGSLIAFELARLFADLEWRAPERLILSAFVAPEHLSRVSFVEGQPIHALDDDALVTFIRTLGAKAAGPALDDPDLRALLLPAVRADFGILAAHAFETRAPIEAPTLAIAGARDPLARPELIEDWRRHARRFELTTHPGGHFFFEEDADFVVSVLRGSVEP